MARVTVEDCVDKVPNRFELVLLAAHRARAIASGAPIAIERDNDKNPVVALREIAEKAVSQEDLKEDLIHSLQVHVEVEEPEAEAAPALPARSVNIFGISRHQGKHSANHSASHRQLRDTIQFRAAANRPQTNAPAIAPPKISPGCSPSVTPT